MKIYRFQHQNQTYLGLEKDGQLAPFSGVDSFQSWLQNPEVETQNRTFALEEVELLAPLIPGKILCSGVNYRGHIDENPDAKFPDFPFFFAKLPNTVIGPGAPIIKPAMTRQLDYEVEFAVVLRQTIHLATPDQALDAVWGYTILHDVSARDVQFKDAQITLGKNFDGFAPLGPCLVSRDEIPDLSDVKLKTLVNGEVLQDGSTSDWVFPLGELLSHLSQVMTLHAGDLVTTGTPAGIGFFRSPQRFLEAGDTVVLEIEGIGRLENPVMSA